jgi:hypothetical protein
MGEVVVAIHQPNLLPWLGYFDKLARCDVFVLLDTVQFSRGSRTNRVQILVNGEPIWLTAPIFRSGHAEPPIRELRINDSRPWRPKALQTLQQSYGSLPGYAETYELIEPRVLDPTEELAALNERAIRAIASALTLDRARIVRASDLEVAGSSSELLAGLVQAVGGTIYLSGDGAGAYFEAAPFERRGIEVRFQRFEHPDYAQRSSAPVHGLSIVDAMMSLGVEGVKHLLP